MGYYDIKATLTTTGTPGQGCIVGDYMYYTTHGQDKLYKLHIPTNISSVCATFINKIAHNSDWNNGVYGTYCVVANSLDYINPKVYVFAFYYGYGFCISVYDINSNTITNVPITASFSPNFSYDTDYIDSCNFLYGISYNDSIYVIMSTSFSIATLYIRKFVVPQTINFSTINAMFDNSYCVADLTSYAPNKLNSTWFANRSITYFFTFRKPTFVKYNNNIYIFGGSGTGALSLSSPYEGVYISSEHCMSNVLKFNLETTSTTIINSNFPHHFDCNGVGFVIDSKIYLTGGIKFDNTATGAKNYSVKIFDTVTNTFSDGGTITQDLSAIGQSIYSPKYGNFAIGTNICATYKYFLESPTNVVATYNNTTNKISLSWTDNSTEETEYYIEKSIDGSVFTQATSGTVYMTDSTSGDTVYWSDPVSADPTIHSYDYRVQARKLVL